ncbi:hypothetical protein F5882DRAFT_494981 [Hyaloscypha sp. PMI_1271]|nr:hypothetical protein F5882DRAFT_494981 [Hyaloscypha sp. PMI_1271]
MWFTDFGRDYLGLIGYWYFRSLTQPKWRFFILFTTRYLGLVVNTIAHWLYKSIHIIGTTGTSWLWWVWRNNAIWLVTHLFLPGLLHSLLGLITTLTNIYTAQGGHWSTAAKIAVIMIGVCTGNMSMLYLVYNHWILEKIKTPRDRALARENHA